MHTFEKSNLWRRTLLPQDDSLEVPRAMLRGSYAQFRSHAAQLAGEIARQLPQLTVHDVSHLDSLWRVASEIAGPDYPINPAEAFVLGGAILMHDAAHVVAAYPEGIAGIKRTVEWADLVAQRALGVEPEAGSEREAALIFEVLRKLHASRARDLPFARWKIPGSLEEIHLIESFELREFYGDTIGRVAESHHWNPHDLVAELADRRLTPPPCLLPAPWTVDVLKVAFLLRVADAAHVDGRRAPWMLFALRSPSASSALHWRFQARMGQPITNAVGELQLCSGSAFDVKDQDAWWLAYDSARMIDRELRAASELMREAGRPPFAARSVAGLNSPEAFSRNVKVKGWEPIDVAPSVGNVPKLVRALGGAQLYGARPELALRELLQNGIDAVRALRGLGELEPTEGRIMVSVAIREGRRWIDVTDTGIGMSRYVLTHVLLDFGQSLWGSDFVRSELPGLLSSGFGPVGKFGIGFYSVFMISENVRVTTRRFVRASGDGDDQWVLEFSSGLDGRPTLRRPEPGEKLKRPGTRVSVELPDSVARRLKAVNVRDSFDHPRRRRVLSFQADSGVGEGPIAFSAEDLSGLLGSLCPALDVSLGIERDDGSFCEIVAPGDWKTIEEERLLTRVAGRGSYSGRQRPLVDIYGATGQLSGRLGYAPFSAAAVTFGGIRNGSIVGLAGVVLGKNSRDLVRLKSGADLDASGWNRWARRLIELVGVGRLSLDARRDLHSLCPELDLAVYEIGEDEYDAAGIAHWIAGRQRVQVFDDSLDYDEDSDDVILPREFAEEIEREPGTLFLPPKIEDLSWELYLPRFDYWSAVRQIVGAAWGAFDEREDFEVVARVNGADVCRQVTVFEAREPAANVG